MKPVGSKIQVGQAYIRVLGTDPLTTILVGVALFLTAAITALGVDLWLRPVDGRPVLQASPPRQPASLALAALVAPTSAPSPSSTFTPSPSPTPTPSPSPTAITYPAAVRIRIPALGVDRSIIEVPLVYDSRSKVWKRDYDQLFRRGRRDLVGHNDGSASPGQPGNMILVGHNYGHGVNGVFLQLGRLTIGQQVEVVNATGQIFAYRVTEVTNVPWTRKDQEQLLQHQDYLSVDGTERLTLVTCGGSSWAPFPNRVYVVAEPAR